MHDFATWGRMAAYKKQDENKNEMKQKANWSEMKQSENKWDTWNQSEWDDVKSQGEKSYGMRTKQNEREGN